MSGAINEEEITTEGDKAASLKNRLSRGNT